MTQNEPQNGFKTRKAKTDRIICESQSSLGQPQGLLLLTGLRPQKLESPKLITPRRTGQIRSQEEWG